MVLFAQSHLYTSDDPLEILRGRTKRLNGFSYPLSPNGRQFGLDFSVAEDDEVNESEMSFVLPFADGARRDGVGDLLEIGGIDTSRHIKNPISLWDHGKVVQFPIGLTETRDTKEYTVSIDPLAQIAKAKVYVYQGKSLPGVPQKRVDDHAVFCYQVFDLWCKRLLRSGSVGYTVIQAKHLSPDYTKGIPAGLHLQKVLMLEASVVALPANQDTVSKRKSLAEDNIRQILCMPKIAGYAPSPYLVKSLQPYVTDTSVTVGFADLQAVRDKYKFKAKEIDSKKTLDYLTKPTPVEKPSTKVKTKAINVRYKQKVIRGFAEVKLKFDMSSLDVDKQNNFIAEMESCGFGRPKQGRWGGEKSRLQSPLKIATFCFDVEPESDKNNAVAEAIRTASEVAHRYGVRYLGNLGSKSLPLTKEKPMAVQTKAMSDNEETMNNITQEINMSEPYGAQFLRQLHDDHGVLMRHYDSLLGPLEPDSAIRKYAISKLQLIERDLSEMEKLFKKHYKELPGLMGGEDDKEMVEDDTPAEEVGGETKDLTEEEQEAIGDQLEDVKEELDAETEDTEESDVIEDTKDMDTMDDPAIGSDSDDREEESPEPEEVADAMKTKGLYKPLNKRMKSLRDKYRVKSNNQKKEERKGPLCKLGQTPKETGCRRNPKWHTGAYSGKGVCSVCGKSECVCPGSAKTKDHPCDKCGKDPCICDVEHTTGFAPDESQVEEMDKEEKVELGKKKEKVAPLVAGAIGYGLSQLLGKNYGTVKEGSQFLNDVAQENSEWDEDKRHKSYHYGRTFEGICSLDEVHEDLEKTPPESDIPPAKQEPGVGAVGEKASPRRNPNNPHHTIPLTPRPAAKESAKYTIRESDFEPTSSPPPPPPPPPKNLGNKFLPSESTDVTPEKAKKILKDGMVHGKPLTEKQRGFFGAIAGKEKDMSSLNNGSGGTLVKGLKVGSEEWRKEEELEHAGALVGAGIESAVGDAVAGDDEDNKDKSMCKSSFCKRCKGASDWFHELARTPQLSGEHRTKSASWHKEIEAALQEDDEEKEEESSDDTSEETDKETPAFEPGEMGEKTLDMIRGATIRQDRVMDELIKQIDGISQRVGLGIFPV